MAFDLWHIATEHGILTTLIIYLCYSFITSLRVYICMYVIAEMFGDWAKGWWKKFGEHLQF